MDASRKSLTKNHDGREEIRRPCYKSVQFAFHRFCRCPENFVQHTGSRWMNERGVSTWSTSTCKLRKDLTESACLSESSGPNERAERMREEATERKVFRRERSGCVSVQILLLQTFSKRRALTWSLSCPCQLSWLCNKKRERPVRETMDSTFSMDSQNNEARYTTYCYIILLRNIMFLLSEHYTFHMFISIERSRSRLNVLVRCVLLFHKCIGNAQLPAALRCNFCKQSLALSPLRRHVGLA